MNKQRILGFFKKFLWGIALALVLVGILIGCTLIRQGYQKKIALKDIETVVYNKQIVFNPQSLVDNSGTANGEKIINKLNSPQAETIIPANSKIRLPFETYCLDPNYSAPESDVPVVFSYEKVDMPLATKIFSYNMAHPELEQAIFQELFWNLSAASQYRFADLSAEAQKLLLAVDAQAEAIVDNYKYNTDLEVKNFVFGRNLPKETVPQNIPGTGLYAKIIDSNSYYFSELEVYNPTSEPQTFQLLKDGLWKLVFVPQDWTKTIKVKVVDAPLDYSLQNWLLKAALAQINVTEIDLEIISGRDYEIKDGTLKTGRDGHVYFALPDGSRVYIGSNKELSIDDLSKKASRWETYLDNILRKLRPLNKFQVKTPTIVSGVRG